MICSSAGSDGVVDAVLCISVHTCCAHTHMILTPGAQGQAAASNAAALRSGRGVELAGVAARGAVRGQLARAVVEHICACCFVNLQELLLEVLFVDGS